MVNFSQFEWDQRPYTFPAPGRGPAGCPSDLPEHHSPRTARSPGKNSPGWHPYLSDWGSIPSPLRFCGCFPSHISDRHQQIHHQLDFQTSTTGRSRRFYFDIEVIVPVVEGQSFSIYEWRISCFSCPGRGCQLSWLSTAIDSWGGPGKLSPGPSTASSSFSHHLIAIMTTIEVSELKRRFLLGR